MLVTFKNKNNNEMYEVTEPVVITDNYNETLDSATIRISHVTDLFGTRLDIEPFDKAILIKDKKISSILFCEQDGDNLIATATLTFDIPSNDILKYGYDFVKGQDLASAPSIELENNAIVFTAFVSKIEDISKIEVKLWYKKEETRYYFDVFDISETQECLDNPIIYEYRIMLVSETKELEGVSLPNLSITRVVDTQYVSSSERTVWYYLKQYLELYAPKIRNINSKIYSEEDAKYNYFYSSQYKFNTVSTEGHPSVQEKFNSKVCPEMQWNTPTLREVLNDLMMVLDCIVVVRNNIIDYIDLTEKKQNITASGVHHINYIQRNRSGADYISELKMDLQNSIQNIDAPIQKNVVTTEYIPVTSNEFIMNRSNYLLKTRYPILKINKLNMICQIEVMTTDPNNGLIIRPFVECDLKHVQGEDGGTYSFIKEKQAWDGLQTYFPYPGYTVEKIINDFIQDGSITIKNLSETQLFNLYYVRGEKEIRGFQQEANRVSFTQSLGTNDWLTMFGNAMLVRTHENPHYGGSGFKIKISPYYDPDDVISGLSQFVLVQSPTPNTYASVFYEIEYETTEDSLFQASKYIAPTHKRVIIDNQTNSWVDTYNQGFLAYQKANRLGNKQLTINARYEDDYENIIKIGDYYVESDGSVNIVFQVEYQIYENHIEVNALATKDYILRNYFTGVRSHIRSWSINHGNETFTRHDLDKTYLEFSFNKKEDCYFMDKYDGLMGVRHFSTYYYLSPLYADEEPEPVKYCLFQTRYPGYVEHRKAYPNVVQYKYTTSGGKVKSAPVLEEQNPYDYSPQTYIIELISRLVGNSITFSFGMESNNIIGKNYNNNYIEEKENAVATTDQDSGPTRFIPTRIRDVYTTLLNGISFSFINYADNVNAETTNIGFSFATKRDIYAWMKSSFFNKPLYKADDPDLYVFIHEWLDDYYIQFYTEYIMQYPLVNYYDFSDYITYEKRKYVYKDNKEILKQTSQFEVCSDTYDIAFSRKFMELQKAIRTEKLNNVRVFHNSIIFELKNEDWEYIENQEALVPYSAQVTVEAGNYQSAPYGGYMQTVTLPANPFLIGKTLEELSITNTTQNIDNQVFFDSSTGELGCIIYSDEDVKQSAIISYKILEEQTAYWQYKNSNVQNQDGLNLINKDVVVESIVRTDLEEEDISINVTATPERYVEIPFLGYTQTGQTSPDLSLVGRAIADLVITETGGSTNNQVEFDSMQGVFNWTIYSPDTTERTATITGKVLGGDPRDSVIFNEQTGDFNVSLYSQNEPPSSIYVTINYKFSTIQLYVYKGYPSDYDFKHLSIANATRLDLDTTITIQSENAMGSDYDCASVEIGYDGDDVYNSVFYITTGDTDDSILLAFVGHTKVYLNRLFDRDCNIYDDNGYIVDTIIEDN